MSVRREFTEQAEREHDDDSPNYNSHDKFLLRMLESSLFHLRTLQIVTNWSIGSGQFLFCLPDPVVPYLAAMFLPMQRINAIMIPQITIAMIYPPIYIIDFIC